MPLILPIPSAAPVVSITLPTPAPDDTGVGHVLEHMVFRGSRRFPDDQLYTHLRYGSLARHLNATTRAESTSYHAESPLPADLARVTEVLWDALFNPLLSPHAFAQEAWHQGPAGPQGIILSEMAGHYAPLPARVEQAVRRALFGKGPAGAAYGGTPAAIPGLSLAALRAFHRRHYLPPRALVLVGGPGAEALAHRIRGLCAATESPAPAAPPPPCRTAVAVAGMAGFGWTLPPAPPALQALAAEVILEAARPAPHSAFIPDSAAPHLVMVAPQSPPDLAALADSLTPAAVAARVEKARRARHDDGRDLRHPAALQLRPAAIGAWLAGGDVAAALDGAGALARLAADPAGTTARLQKILAAMAAAPLVDRRAEEPPPPPRAKAEDPRPRGQNRPLPPLPREILPQSAGPRADVHPLGPLPLAGGEGMVQLHLALPAEGIDDLTALAAFAARLGRALEPLGARVAPAAGGRAALSLALTLPAGEVADFLDTLPARAGGVAEGPAIPPRPLPPHLAMETWLRGRFEGHWARVDGVQGIALARALAEGRPTDKDALVGIFEKLFNPMRVLGAATAPLGHPAAMAPFPPSPLPATGGGTPPALFAAGDDLYTQGLACRIDDLPPAHLAVALKAVECGLLWPEIRVKGGAYGIRTGLAGPIATLWSARDPRALPSLAIMRGSGRWLAGAAEGALLERARVAACAALLPPATRAEALAEAVDEQLSGRREEDFDALHSMTPADLARAGEALDAALAGGAGVVIASRPALTRAGFDGESAPALAF